MSKQLTKAAQLAIAEAAGMSTAPPVTEAPYDHARRIVCEEWQRAVKEFGLTPSSVTETVVSRIIGRLDDARASR